ncbi:MAG: T9SS type A sorting domain-containing protein, partial [Bacteroidales bacterium]|nr:T9SS type A sorting domain-containing protein [Bacteroidales bacterium]
SNQCGCDSVVTLHLTVTTIHYDLWDTDGYWEIGFADPAAEYQWVYCENYEPIEGETYEGFLYPPMLDTYYACIITLNGCSDTTNCFFYTDEAVEDWNDGLLTLYPNPTTGMVNVQCTMNNVQLGAGEIQVLDVYGRLLQNVETCHGASLQAVQIDLSRYATGIYLVRLVNGGKVMAVRKVVRE